MLPGWFCQEMLIEGAECPFSSLMSAILFFTPATLSRDLAFIENYVSRVGPGARLLPEN